MHNLDRNKFYNAIYEFLSETIEPEKASNQANVMVDNIIETTAVIDEMMHDKKTDPIILSKQFHTLKNLLLYGDFYYESDICQDIEIELRKKRKISNIVSFFDELISSLKSNENTGQKDGLL